MTASRLQLSQSARYRIVVQGCLQRSCSYPFDGFNRAVDIGQGTTTLQSQDSDQAALHGVLARIRDLGLPLLVVAYVHSEIYKER